MINKKNLLGHTPEELGTKDALHVAIVSAGRTISPGTRCSLNEYREAVPDAKGIGVADPFLKNDIPRGESFWMLLGGNEIPTVKHVWEHEKIDFSPPNREVQYNKYLLEYAKVLNITYEQLMDVCGKVVATGLAQPYPGNDPDFDFEEALEDEMYDLWSSWADETNYEFENYGSACCPEYEYPEVLFKDK